MRTMRLIERSGRLLVVIALATEIGACAGRSDRRTLATLRAVEPDLAEVEIDDGIEQAMEGYRTFLEQAPSSALTPEAMRRLADLKLEQEYGLLGEGGPPADPAPTSAADPLPAPQRAMRDGAGIAAASTAPDRSARPVETDRAFEQRASATSGRLGEAANASFDLELPGAGRSAPSGPLEAITLYDQILEAYPNYPHNDQVLYQKARAYDELGRVDEAIEVAALLVARHPDSRHVDELQFRRAEYFFTRKKFLDAEDAYTAIVSKGASSDYYELALYKLGWTLYKQMLLEEALARYVELLDHKVAADYDFDQTADEATAQRISDTYRVVSLCFSELGGPDAIGAFFATNGSRPYENRVYRQLGEFYFEKLRYADAATTYEAFVSLYPIHRVAPHFSMRVVEIYEAGGFPKLVLESKKRFAESYALESVYWQHFDVSESPEVLDSLRSNLEDLANHYHALYQATEEPEEKPAHFAESTTWYRAYLTSFPTEAATPGIHYQLADLLLENADFGEAASEYERIAYEYPPHERSSAAGYAAIFAHRRHEEVVVEEAREAVRREAVASTLRFVDRFPEHENAAAVLGAALADVYGLDDHEQAIEIGHRLLDAYPNAEIEIRRSAWLVVAHASFDIERFAEAESAYLEVLELTAEDDESARKVMDNLAAAIYKQGEQAAERDDQRGAAGHFLRIAAVAPFSEIRPVAEYDAASALIRVEAWAEAAAVLEGFREAYPSHDLHQEATRQIAFVYREDGQLERSAEEYERVAAEAEDPGLQGESLLLAGDLYEEANALERALGAFEAYVIAFPKPLEVVVATRFRMSEIEERRGRADARLAQLREIVELDRKAGDERTDNVRLLAARAALTLAEGPFEEFVAIELVQPFERSLQRKQSAMERAQSGFEALLDYEVGEVTAAATFYIAEIYGEFSRALMASERPEGLGARELEDYEMVLEEEAYPFEEESIAVHQKNLELMGSGVFNRWIERSLGQLAVVMPGRYAKFELSVGLLTSIETYAYRAPQAEAEAQLADAAAPPGVAEEATNSEEAEGAMPTAPGVAPESTRESAPPAAPDPAWSGDEEARGDADSEGSTDAG